MLPLLLLSQVKPRLDPPRLHLTPDVTASLDRDAQGVWQVILTGPASPSNWAADPDGLQLSIENVAPKPGEAAPLLRFLNPSEAVQATPVEGRPESVARVPVEVAMSGPDPGFAQLRSSGFVLGSDSRTNKTVSLPVRVSSRRVYIPRPIAPPKLEPGLRFFYLPDRKLDLKDEDGTPIPYEKAMLKELRLESAELGKIAGFPLPIADSNKLGAAGSSDASPSQTGNQQSPTDNSPPIDNRQSAIENQKFTLHLRLEGWPRPVTLSGSGDPLHIPGLPPILWDETARQLRIKYLNKPVWIYGGQLGAMTTTPDEWVGLRVGVDKPVRITKILRLGAQRVPLNVGPQIAALGGETLSTFLTDCPIYVVVDTGRQGMVTAAMGSSTDDMTKLYQRKGPLAGFQICADDWQFERIFSLKSGPEQHPDWSPTLQRAVSEGKLQKGMSHAMVAWTLGWPGDPGAKPDLMKQPRWRYDIVTPYSFWVYFNGDRVERFEEESRG